MNSMAMCSTWREMGSVRLYLADDSPYDENKQPYHTRSVAARINKDCAFHRTPGWRCQACCWCVIKDLWNRQHYGHMEHKDTKSFWETPGTNTRNGQIQMEYPWTLWNEMEEFWQNSNRGRTQGFLQLDFLFSRTLLTLSWDVAQSPACSLPSAWGQSLSTSQ